MNTSDANPSDLPVEVTTSDILLNKDLQLFQCNPQDIRRSFGVLDDRFQTLGAQLTDGAPSAEIS